MISDPQARSPLEFESEAGKAAGLISVVFAAFDAERFLARTLASGQRQTYRNIKILVDDDGSHDRTPAIASAAAKQDPRVRLIRQANAGVAAARNRGIAEAAGDLVAILDADDLWHPEKLERQRACILKGGPGTALVYCWKCRIDEHDQVLTAWPLTDERRPATFRNLLHNNFICASAPLMRRTAVLEVAGYDPSLRGRGGEGCEDKKLYLLLARRFRLDVVPSVLVAYRVMPGSMFQRPRQMKRSHDLVFEDIRNIAPEVSAGWFAAGMCRAELDLSARMLRCRQYADAGNVVLGSLRRWPVATVREILSGHGLTLPRRLLSDYVPGTEAPQLDWAAPGLGGVSPRQSACLAEGAASSCR